MFSEPQNVTIGSATTPLQRTAFGDRKGIFEDNASHLRLTLSHILGKRVRRTVRLDFAKTSADPFLTGVNRPLTGSVYVVIDTPPDGFTVTEQQNYLLALSSWLDLESNRLKIVNGES